MVTLQQSISPSYKSSHSVTPTPPPLPLEVLKRTDGGVCVWGMFLEGAHWDKDRRVLVDCQEGQLHDQLPLLVIRPAVNGAFTPDSENTYT